MFLWAYHTSHLALNWRVPLHRGALEFFARYFTVVNVDLRGAGLSERHIDGLSLDRFVDDFDAVLKTLDLDRVAVIAIGPTMLIACHIAATLTDRVCSLISIQGGESEAVRRVLNLRHLNPQVEAHLRAALLCGIEDRDAASSVAAIARQALEPRGLREWEQVLASISLLEMAARVTTPTLYFNVADDEVVPLSSGQALVARMPQARLITVPGRSAIDVWRDRGCPADGVVPGTAFRHRTERSSRAATGTQVSGRPPERPVRARGRSPASARRRKR
jgi:pimeloyl-ACP methyl ester carboxylesterase